MHISNQVILDKSLFKAVVRNDMKDILRLIDLGADVNYEFTIDELIHNRLIDDNAITTIKNAEITVDELIGRSRCRGVKNLYILNGLKIYDEEITAIKNNSCSKIIVLPIIINSIILSTESKLSPLQLAIMYGWKEAIIELIKKGANPSVINTKGLSPLYFSITGNNEEMTKLLLKYKANPDISHQISILFNVLNGVKNDSDIKIIESTLKKIKDIAEFLKFKDIPVDYSLFYQSVDIAEKNDKKSTTKKVMELLDELTYPMSQIQDLNLHQHSSQSECSKTMGLS